MDQLSKKEIEILRFIRTARHKTTAGDIARGLNLPENEVEVLASGMAARRLIHRVPGEGTGADSFYTNPEFREKIFELLG